MMELKACPRCHGDMRVSHDVYGDYKQCFQCGNTIELEPTTRRRLILTMRVGTAKVGMDQATVESMGYLALSDG